MDDAGLKRIIENGMRTPDFDIAGGVRDGLGRGREVPPRFLLATAAASLVVAACLLFVIGLGRVPSDVPLMVSDGMFIALESVEFRDHVGVIYLVMQDLTGDWRFGEFSCLEYNIEGRMGTDVRIQNFRALDYDHESGVMRARAEFSMGDGSVFPQLGPAEGQVFILTVERLLYDFRKHTEVILPIDLGETPHDPLTTPIRTAWLDRWINKCWFGDDDWEEFADGIAGADFLTPNQLGIDGISSIGVIGGAFRLQTYTTDVSRQLYLLDPQGNRHEWAIGVPFDVMGSVIIPPRNRGNHTYSELFFEGVDISRLAEYRLASDFTAASTIDFNWSIEITQPPQERIILSGLDFYLEKPDFYVTDARIGAYTLRLSLQDPQGTMILCGKSRTVYPLPREVRWMEPWEDGWDVRIHTTGGEIDLEGSRILWDTRDWDRVTLLFEFRERLDLDTVTGLSVFTHYRDLTPSP